MVLLGAKRSLRLASICRLLVMNGGEGLRRCGFFSTSATRKAPASRSSKMPSTWAALVGLQALAPCFTRRARKGGGAFPARQASRDQYSSGTKAWMARSRSHTRRRATDCTRPALRRVRTQEDLGDAGGRLAQLLDDLGLAEDGGVFGRKILLQVHPQFMGGQILD